MGATLLRTLHCFNGQRAGCIDVVALLAFGVSVMVACHHQFCQQALDLGSLGVDPHMK